MNDVSIGLDRFLADPPNVTKDARLGVLTNPSGVDRQLRTTVNLLTEDPRFHVTALFGPEHGVRGEAQAGEHVDGGIDRQTGLPIHSLYGANRKPSPEMLEDIDILIVDLQDIGVRYTTYLSTVASAIDACSGTGKLVMILDRPNPLGGERVAGNILELELASFVGIHAMPVLHGLTIGEFGKLWARDQQLDPPVVVPMQGWTRDMWFDRTGLPWVFPSPNLPTLDSSIVYPATCLIEGTSLSEGRGTTRPFETIGAPWIDPEVLAASLTEIETEGIGCRPLYFTPTFSKHHGERCGGIQIHILDRNKFDAVGFGPQLLATIKWLYPDKFAWLPPTDGVYFVDKLAGSTALRETVDSGGNVEVLLNNWQGDSEAFRTIRSDILLY